MPLSSPPAAAAWGGDLAPCGFRPGWPPAARAGTQRVASSPTWASKSPQGPVSLLCCQPARGDV